MDMVTVSCWLLEAGDVAEATPESVPEVSLSGLLLSKIGLKSSVNWGCCTTTTVGSGPDSDLTGDSTVRAELASEFEWKDEMEDEVASSCCKFKTKPLSSLELVAVDEAVDLEVEVEVVGAFTIPCKFLRCFVRSPLYLKAFPQT